MDFKHFNGNQTHIGQSARYLNVFNLLPYYSNSTNNRYFEAHSEYNDEGYIMNKIPLLNKLKSTLILGMHFLPRNKPYTELSVGFDNLGLENSSCCVLIMCVPTKMDLRRCSFGLKFLNVLE
jgi:hypothetical protein